LEQFLEPDGPDRLRFRNSMIRDAAYEGLAYRLRAKLHAAAGRAVEKLSTDLEADADTLSLHYWRAGDDAKTWTYARMAGDRAAHAYANVEAATQYDRAWQAAVDAGVSKEERLALLSSSIQVQLDASMYRDAVTSCDRAITLAGDDPILNSQFRLRRARVYSHQIRYNACLRDVTRAEKALEGLPRTVEVRRQLVEIASQRASVRQNQYRLSEALSRAEAYVDEARELGQTESLITGLMIIDVSRFQLGDPNIGANGREALALARKEGLQVTAGTMANLLGGLQMLTGDWAGAESLWRESYDLCLTIGNVAGAGQAALSLAELQYSRGDLDAAEHELAEASRLLTSAGVSQPKHYADMLTARVRLAQGHVEEAETRALAAGADLRDDSDGFAALEAAIVRAEAMTRLGRPAEALVWLEEQEALSAEAATTLLPRLCQERSRATAALGDLDEAERLAVQGLDAAVEMGLIVERYGLLVYRSELAEQRGDTALVAALGEETSTLADELGIVGHRA
ncbi:MAG: hypothetical protein U0R76_17855, partial [Candidatus Nanopelagicales bacterium]